MKLLKLITEERKVLPYHKKIVKIMDKRSIDDDTIDIWNFLTKDLDIEKLETKLEIIHLYQKYYGMDTEDFDDMSDEDLSDMESIEDVDDKKMALSLNLNVPPILLEQGSYEHYGLELYTNIDDNTEYAIGDDEEATYAMRSYFEDFIENQGGFDYVDRWLLDDYIELDSYSVEQFAEEESEHRVGEMDEDEVIDEAGYDDKASFEERIAEYETEIEDFNYEKEDLEIELADLDIEEDEDEMESIEDKIQEIEYEISEKESEVEELQSELDDLYDTAKEELLETYKDNIIDDINSQGVDYFIDNFGWELGDAIESYCTFDNDEFEQYLADNEDRGDTLASYDGEEEEEEYDGEWYYIYRID
jgi:cell division protein FtsL